MVRVDDRVRALSRRGPSSVKVTRCLLRQPSSNPVDDAKDDPAGKELVEDKAENFKDLGRQRAPSS